MDEIPKAELDAIRRLNDQQLTKLILEISMYSRSKAEPLLRMMMQGEAKGMDRRI
jgi:hypothetical protein